MFNVFQICATVWEIPLDVAVDQVCQIAKTRLAKRDLMSRFDQVVGNDMFCSQMDKSQIYSIWRQIPTVEKFAMFLRCSLNEIFESYCLPFHFWGTLHESQLQVKF